MSKSLKIIGIGIGIIVTAGAAAGALLGSALVGTAAGNALAIGINLAFTAGVMKTIGGIERLLSPKSRSKAGDPGAQMESAGTLMPREIVYGRVRKAGMNVIPLIGTGADFGNLHQALTVAGHEIAAFEKFYLNKEEVTPGSITGSVNDGLVSAGTYANVTWLRGYLGTSGQTADYILDNEIIDWTVNHRGRGVAYIACKFKADAEKFKTGKPDVAVLVRGKICYDPRLDVTPGASPTNASYRAWTNNSALCIADYLLDASLGVGEAATEINWTDVVTAANECDENVTVPDGLGGSTTQKRYTCNVILSAADEFNENLEILAGSMLGRVWREGLKWRMVAGAWQTESFALTKDDLVGKYEIQTDVDIREKFNSVRGFFLDAANEYVQTEFPPRINTAYATSDGETIQREVQMPTCTDVYEAQRNAIVTLRQSRNRKRLMIECGLNALNISLFDTGTVVLDELGLTTSTKFRCVGWQLMQEGRIVLTLQEEYSTDWTDPVWNVDYTTAGSIANPVNTYTRPGTPTSFTATGVAGGVAFTWAVGDPYVDGQQYIVYEANSGAAFGTASEIWRGPGTGVFVARSVLATKDYWLAATFQGLTSSPTPAGAGVAATPLSVYNTDPTGNESGAGVTITDPSYPEGSFERYGAVGNNIVDDTAAIQAALDVMWSAGGGRAFGQPGKNYKMTSAAVVGSFVEVDGQGCSFTMHANNTPHFKLSKDASLNQGMQLHRAQGLWNTPQDPVLHPNSYLIQLYEGTGVTFDVRLDDLRAREGVGLLHGPETAGAAFLVTSNNLIASQCSGYAFYYWSTTGSTTHTMTNCWAAQDNGSEIATSAFGKFRNLYSFSFDIIAVDHGQANEQLFLESCFGNIGQLAIESCDRTASSGQQSFVRISNSSVSFDRIQSQANEIVISGSAEFGLLLVNTSNVRIGLLQDTYTELTDTSSGAYYTIYCSGTGNRIYVEDFIYVAGTAPAPNGTIAESSPPVQVLRFAGNDRGRYEGGKYVSYGTAAPVSGTYATGDRVWNTNPTTGIAGWVCTAGGTPGTWAGIGGANTTTGSFGPQVVGVSGSVFATVHWTRIGSLVHIRCNSATGTSNATTLSLAALDWPTAIRPARSQTMWARAIDSGVGSEGYAILQTTGQLDFYKAGGGAFANTGTKGTDFFNATYSLD